MTTREFTIKAAAKHEQVTPRTVHRWIAQGAIEPARVRKTPGGHIRVLLEIDDDDDEPQPKATAAPDRRG
jgi:helix-turn-helix protein